ncbi:Mitochondrial import receptor subunit TOM20-3 [Striga hermonthica]|uniref:Mitochondrial import receptor subunit TOM20-3 n=1 Tax=Striga hermonthica TaxID=68872 RepID=A0A9N7NPK3_STRHE|nr:Mitochondrial import receptor subunit TOM20-3 [Striga hermonthica]
MDMSIDYDQRSLFEDALKKAEATYAKNPLDAENLTRWGGVLLELSQYQEGPKCKDMVKLAIDKLEEAVTVNPKNANALWCLGNAYTSNAFLIQDFDEAKDYFEKATQYLEQASELEPQNDLYRRSVEMSSKAPELHVEIHKHSLGQQALGPEPSLSTRTKQQSSKRSRSSDLKYDIFGWVILAVGIFAWVGFAKSNVPPPPPR